jgi:carbon-monoxide dehydrogenase small subunit
VCHPGAANDERMVLISTTVDGADHADEVEPRLLLVHYLRTCLGRTGTVVGCDTSNCGACTVLLDGLSVKSCTLLAVQADGAEITTVQGLADGDLHPVQRKFAENHALQCGYCTAGMIMSAVDLLMENPDPSEQEVRDGLEGNLILGLLLGHRRRIVIMTAAAPPGGYPPARTVL